MRGFTLIELITVLVILGILSVFAVPRLSGADAFSVTSARDTGLSVARQVQLRAMQQEDPSDSCVALEIAASRLGGSSALGCGFTSGRTDVVDLSDTSVRIVSSLTAIHFDLLGRPYNEDGARICTTQCEITFAQGTSSAKICLNSEGFFYACR